MTPLTPLRNALADANLLGSVLAGDSWRPWRVLLLAAMGEGLFDDERALFAQLTQRQHEPGQRVDEFVGVIGRRGGKSRAISVLAAYVAGLCQHPALVRGERGVLLIIAPDQRQAEVVLDYTAAAFEQSPLLAQLVETRTQRSLKLVNRIDIEVRACDFRRLRGNTYVAVICDEAAFWRTDYSANPDSEILAAVRPRLATTRGPLFIISSPYARRGELWSLYNKHFGPHGDALMLVARATSRTMNPTLSQVVVDRARERDPAAAAAEYDAEFRRDIESFVSIEAVQACVANGVYEHAPARNVSYRAFCDPSGGSADSFTLAVGHYEATRQVVVIDALREARPPFSPEQVVGEFAELLRTYRLQQIIADRYAGAWVTEQFAKFGVSCAQAAKPKSDLYGDLLPLINSRRIELLDHARCLSQLIALELRSVRGGRDSIDHPPHGHDDLINAAAGCASLLITSANYNIDAMCDGADDPTPVAVYRKGRLRCPPTMTPEQFERISQPIGLPFHWEQRHD